jgi:hypothetical protein
MLKRVLVQPARECIRTQGHWRVRRIRRYIRRVDDFLGILTLSCAYDIEPTGSRHASHPRPDGTPCIVLRRFYPQRRTYMITRPVLSVASSVILRVRVLGALMRLYDYTGWVNWQALP